MFLNTSFSLSLFQRTVYVLEVNTPRQRADEDELWVYPRRRANKIELFNFNNFIILIIQIKVRTTNKIAIK